MIGKAPEIPGVTEKSMVPAAPDPVICAGASTTFGTTAIGIRTDVPAPRQVKKPVAALSNGAVRRVKVTRNVLV